MLCLTLDQKNANFFCHCCHGAIRKSILSLFQHTVCLSLYVLSSSANTSNSASYYIEPSKETGKKQNSLKEADIL